LARNAHPGCPHAAAIGIGNLSRRNLDRWRAVDRGIAIRLTFASRALLPGIEPSGSAAPGRHGSGRGGL